MELKEMIKVMEHYENDGEVEFKQKREDDTKWRLACPSWDWDSFDYRIKEPNVTIEKWLCSDKQGDFVVIETSDIDAYLLYDKKVKLLDTYEVEL